MKSKFFSTPEEVVDAARGHTRCRIIPRRYAMKKDNNITWLIE